MATAKIDSNKNSKIDQLLKEVVQLKVPDLEGFVEKALRILEKRKAPNYHEKEKALIEKIKNGGPSDKFWKQFDALSIKLEQKQLSADEQKIMEQLIKEMEQWNYDRLLLMKDLANHWDINLEEIPKRLKIKPRKRVYA